MFQCSQRVRRLPITIYVIGGVLALPILIPVAIVQHGLYRRRLLKCASRFQCLTCGALLGKKAVALADKACQDRISELMRVNPGVRFRLRRTLHAICPSCETRYSYSEKGDIFTLETDSVSNFAGEADPFRGHM